MVGFSGWEMPVWYPSGQSAEHHANRKRCGLFDICHMGEFEAFGKDTLAFWQRVLTNDIPRMADGQAMYNFMLNPQGGVIDDCILYRFNPERWMLVVNAGNIETDFQWLQENKRGDFRLENRSQEIAKIDLQGPAAPRLITHLVGMDIIQNLKFFRFLPDIGVGNVRVILSRTGYTGEIGFEIYIPAAKAVSLWNFLLEEGRDSGLMPCGLGARDTLRTEAGLPLHGHEIDPNHPALVHPWEFVFAWGTGFIGEEALQSQLKRSIPHFIQGFQLDGRSKAMRGWVGYLDGEEIGEVTTGVISPTLGNKPIGFVRLNRKLEVDTRLSFMEKGKGRRLTGRLVSTPFVPLTSRRKMANFL